MKKVLITGGAGNVGGSLARKLVSDGNFFVIIVDNLSTGSKDKLPVDNHDRWRFIKADVNVWADIAPILLSNSISHVFHYAAVVGVKRTLLNPIKVLNDIEGIKNVLSLCKNTDVERIFFSSSSEVYGEPFEIPQYEDTTPLNSRLPYAIVKNVAEAYCKSYYHFDFLTHMAHSRVTILLFQSSCATPSQTRISPFMVMDNKAEPSAISTTISIPR